MKRSTRAVEMTQKYRTGGVLLALAVLLSVIFLSYRLATFGNANQIILYAFKPMLQNGPLNMLSMLERCAWGIFAGTIISMLFLVVPQCRAALFLLYSWCFLLVFDAAHPFSGTRFYLWEGVFWLLIFASWVVAAFLYFRDFEAAVFDDPIRLHFLDGLLNRVQAFGSLFQERATPRDIFLLIAFALGAYYLFGLILWHRMPLGHDTFQYMQLQYVSLNERVSKGVLPLWAPFLTKGTVNNWWILMTSHLVADIYYVIAPAIRWINDYYLFFFATYCDELIFAIGSIALACELYETIWAVFFAVTAAVFSTVWMYQIWWNFRLYCWLPFSFYFFLRFLRTGRWRHFLLFCLIAPLNFFASLPYFIAPISLTEFLFCIFSSIAIWPEVKSGLITSSQTKGWVRSLLKGLSALAVSGALMGILYLFLRSFGAEAIALHHFGRDTSGAVTEIAFLSYGPDIGWNKFLALLTGFSDSSLDQTCYVGLCTCIFALLSLYYYWRKNPAISRLSHAFLVLVVLSASFSTGGMVSKLAYRYWPTMKLFRYIGLTGGIAKLFLIFYAAFGLDLLAKSLASNSAKREELRVVLVILVALLCFKFLSIQQMFDSSSDLKSRLQQALSAWNGASLVIIWLPVLFLIAALRKRSADARVGFGVLALFSLVHFIDLVGYRATQDAILGSAVTPDLVDTFRFYDYSFMPERSQNYLSNWRFASLQHAIFREFQDIYRVRDHIAESKNGEPTTFAENIRWRFGGIHWTENSFFYFDPCRSLGNVPDRLDSVDEFYSVYQSAHPDVDLETPMPQQTAFLKIVGCGYPKLQVFKRIYLVPDKTLLRLLLASSAYQGDVLFSSDGFASPAAKTYLNDANVLHENDRVDASLRVEAFNSNGIRLSVDNPRKSPAILFYSDAWHRGWKAIVNGVERPIYAANLGFKAVEIPAGASKVEFYYSPPFVRVVLWTFIGFNIMMTFVLFGTIFSPCFSVVRNNSIELKSGQSIENNTT